MAKIEKMDREQLLYIIAEEFGGDGKAWEQLAVEMVKAMSDTQAREILGYIARMWDIDTMGYEASAKKSKMKKTPLVDINPDDISLNINFASSGMTPIDTGEVHFDLEAEFLGGDRYGGDGISARAERLSYQIADFINPSIIQELRKIGADCLVDQINERWHIDDEGKYRFRYDFGNINGMMESAKKSKVQNKSFNSMVNDVKHKNNQKKVI